MERRQMLNIRLPETLEPFLKDQAIATGFSNESEYVQSLILREQRRLAQQVKVDALLIEGLDSGDAIEATDDWWAQKRAQISDRIQPSQG